MSKLEELIQKYCPEGVEYKPIWSLTAWDKKFNGIEDKSKQKKVIKYNYLLAADLKSYHVEGGTVKLLTTNVSNLFTTEELAEGLVSDGEVVAIPWGGNPIVQYYKGRFLTADNRIATSLDTTLLNNKFLYYCMLSQMKLIASFYRGSGIKHPEMSKVLDLEIPLPPLPVQEEIVRILDAFASYTAELQAELQARKQQYQYYRDNLLSFEGRDDVEWKKLGEVGKVSMCKRILKDQTSSSGDIPFYKIGTFGGDADAFISNELFDTYKSKYSYPNKGDILISAAGTIGRTVVFDGQPAYFQDSNIVWLKHDESVVLNSFLRYIYSLNPWAISTGGTIARLYNDNILNAVIPVPSLAEQQKIVDILDRFDTLTNDLAAGLPAEIEKRRQQYEYYRDKLLTFKRKES